jgi:hypothetical protein
MEAEQDWFKIYDIDIDDPMPIISDLINYIKGIMEHGTTTMKVKETDIAEDPKKRLLTIVIVDLIIEYRFGMSYVSKATAPDPGSGSIPRQMLLDLSSHSLSYSAFLQNLMGSLGGKDRKIPIPLKIDSRGIDDLIKSHIALAKKIESIYGDLAKDLGKDNPIHEAILEIKKTKSEHVENIVQTSEGV